MSWLARSFANSLRLDDGDEENYSENDVASTAPNDPSPSKRNDEATSLIKQKEFDDPHEEEAQARGVKEDITELKQTLTRQFWGVASFLAPPPQDDRSRPESNQPEPSDRSESCGEEEEAANSAGIGDEFAEIGGRFRKMASSYFPFGSEENERENRRESGVEEEELETEVGEEWEVAAIGVTDEVLAFARNIAMHPETWLDFPLDEEEDLDDFHMSDAQREHAMAIERLAPRLAALRIELCPCHMTESYFWKVYFVLLHSRLNKHDAEVLSTPQVMEARAMWMQELHQQTKAESDWYERGASYVKDNPNVLHKDYEYGRRTFDFEHNASVATYNETEKLLVISTEMPFIDKPVIEEKRVTETEVKDLSFGPSSKLLVPESEDNDDDWLNDEDPDLGGYKSTIPLGNEEDISFSDLEDDASGTILSTSKTLSSFKE